MNILITGSSGFIANHLMKSLRNKYMIYGIDLKKSTNTKYALDVKKTLKSQKLPKKIDLIINLLNYQLQFL